MRLDTGFGDSSDAWGQQCRTQSDLQHWDILAASLLPQLSVSRFSNLDCRDDRASLLLYRSNGGNR